MAIRTFIPFQEVAQGSPQFGPTGNTPCVSFGTPPEGKIRLNDDRDSTGWTLTGTAAAPKGLVFYMTGALGSVPSESIPGNTTYDGVTIVVRAAAGSCVVSTLRPYFQNEALSAAVAVPSTSFTEVSLPLDDISPTALFSDYFTIGPTGVVVENDCATGGAQEVNVSEARIEIDFGIPDPTVTSVAAVNTSPLSAVLRGGLMVNQAPIDDGTAFPETFSTLFPVTLRAEIGDKPTELTTVATLGPFYGTVPGGTQHNNPAVATRYFEVEVGDLLPNTVYYFRFVASHEDGEFFGDTLPFTTPLTDPIKGVY